MAGSWGSSPHPATAEPRAHASKLPANGSALRPSQSQTTPLRTEHQMDDPGENDWKYSEEPNDSSGGRFAKLANGSAKGTDASQPPLVGVGDGKMEGTTPEVAVDWPTDDFEGMSSPSPHVRRASDSFLNAQQPALPDIGRKEILGTATPPGRRSVQFARDTTSFEPQSAVQSRHPSEGGEESDAGRMKGQSLLSKLKALAASSAFQTSMAVSHTRTPSGGPAGETAAETKSSEAVQSQTPDRPEPQHLGNLIEEESDADADAEPSGEEESDTDAAHRKKRRKTKRPVEDGTQTAPVTPKTPLRPGLFPSSTTTTPGEPFRPKLLTRRATTNDMPEAPRGGVSEDEGRDRLNRESPWRRRGSAWLSGARGMSSGPSHRPESENRVEGHSQATLEHKRPMNLRSLTGFGRTEGAEGAVGAWRARHRASDRTTSVSAQRWKQIKASLRLIAQRRKPEIDPMDHAKSAELLAELAAGAPAALLLASMFQRDEHGGRRVPVLLEQVRAHIVDSQQVDGTGGERHQIFRVALEYGSGMSRMKWVIYRTVQDFFKLHLKYKLHFSTQKYLQLRSDDKNQKLPRFPRSAFPYLRGYRNFDMDSEGEEDEDEAGNETAAEEPSNGADPRKNRPRRPSLNITRLRSSITGTQLNSGRRGSTADGAQGKRELYPEKQRKKLEIYLQKLIRFLIFRPDSSRLCKFLEISALGVRLAAEGSYHGKEGLLVIQSAKGLDFRKSLTPTLFKARHTPKWFLVRHSYIVCVDSPEEMHIYDVFLVDSDFRLQASKSFPKDQRLRDQKARDIAKVAKDQARHPQHHRLSIQNSERKLRLLARNERQLGQFEKSINFMLASTDWAKKNRFDSFAPVRQNVFAQWLVDGRDYMWCASRAISQAKDVIYIHDWWLSPEIYMRRPAAISQKWRLDRLLQRKAQQGVKVFVIMYRNINSAIPIDSEYSKFSLLDLHPNVFVQRSPNQFRQNLFFWAHHEKICIVDHTVAFVGGIDLCFGRWDTPQHTVVDDKMTGFEEADQPKDADHCQLWPGKDYSNPRVQDFYALDKPYEEMYDRAKVPRMPWHDIHMQVVGQPARDLTRHFVQRWNYILRQRKPTRPTPFLLPPPDFEKGELEELGLDGSCEVQILRSCAMWSIGTPERTECSIMNAYIKMIEQSDHFVYIENQFFVSSCEVEGTKIENKIGDALVERIIRAAQNQEVWRAVVLIPLMPGFQNTVDSQDGTSVRLIMQCQFRSICRGESSIFGRLRAQGIEPEDYIQFYSLRSWGKIGPSKQLVTEQLYIHAKCMVVDDRIAIIGSANINERSMLGSRDSECAAVVRDTHMIWSRMDGEPYLVGRFAHSLRMRLMREHLGLNVDEITGEEQEEVAGERRERWEQDMDDFHGEDERSAERGLEERVMSRKHQIQEELLDKEEKHFSFNHDVDWEQSDNPNLKSNRKLTQDTRVTENTEHRKDVLGEGFDHLRQLEQAGFAKGRDTAIVANKEVLISHVAPEGRGTLDNPKKGSVSAHSAQGQPVEQGNTALPPPSLPRLTTSQMGLPLVATLPSLPQTDDSDIGGPGLKRGFSQSTQSSTSAFAAALKRPFVDKDCMRDPINDVFYLDTWHAVAENNTKIFREVFRCMPDSDVKSWKDYKEYTAYSERFAQLQGTNRNSGKRDSEQHPASGPPGTGMTGLPAKISALASIGETSQDSKEAHKRAVELKEKLMDRVNKQKEDSATDEKLQAWAVEANRAQAQREEELFNEKLPDGAIEKATVKKTESWPASPTLASPTLERDPHGQDQQLKQLPKTLTSLKEEIEGKSLSDGERKHQAEHSLNYRSDSPTDPEKSPVLHQKPPTPPQHHGSEPFVGYSNALNMNATAGSGTVKRRRRATTRSSRREFRASDDIMAMGEAEELLGLVQGHLVAWPYDWLQKEEQGGNWLYSIDQLAPLEIYN